jgi:hypothetical protein
VFEIHRPPSCLLVVLIDDRRKSLAAIAPATLRYNIVALVLQAVPPSSAGAVRFRRRRSHMLAPVTAKTVGTTPAANTTIRQACPSRLPW